VPATVASSNALAREITLTTPIDIAGNASLTVVFSPALGLVNAALPGTYSLQAWTSQQSTPATSPNFDLMEMTQVTAALVQPDPINLSAASQYTIGFRLGTHGHLTGGQDAIYIKFPSATTITGGALTQVLVNNLNATAQGYNATDSIAITLPASLNLTSGDSVTVSLPASAVQNPATLGEYSLFVSTSVEKIQSSSQPYALGKFAGAPIAGTVGQASRSNQGKTFYHDGKWWLAALSSNASDKNWYLWKFEGGSWSKTLLLHANTKVRPDMSLVPGANKLYIFFPGTPTTQLSRLTYAGGNWSIDAGYPKTVNNVVDDEMSLVRAQNGNLWVFWISNYMLQGQRSSDDGATWSSPIAIKSGLNIGKGLTDGVAFAVNGAAALGLGYAEDSTPTTTLFGFLYHKDSDPDNVWTDESNSLTLPPGAAANNHLQMAVYNNKVFMIVKISSGANTVKNALYLRETNNTWARYDIINDGAQWTRPALALDETHQVLYVFGTVEATPRLVEMKRVPFGQYASLLSAPRETVLCYENEDFFALGMPSHNYTAAMNLMIVAENETRNVLWYRVLPLQALSKTNEASAPAPPAPVADEALTAAVYPNPFNPSTAIHFRLREPALVRLQIFNINGQLVRTLVEGELAAGAHVYHWNARNQKNGSVSTGTYFYRLQAGTQVQKGVMQLLK